MRRPFMNVPRNAGVRGYLRGDYHASISKLAADGRARVLALHEGQFLAAVYRNPMFTHLFVFLFAFKLNKLTLV